jgi:tRNA-dihydrouridine synthase A
MSLPGPGPGPATAQHCYTTTSTIQRTCVIIPSFTQSCRRSLSTINNILPNMSTAAICNNTTNTLHVQESDRDRPQRQHTRCGSGIAPIDHTLSIAPMMKVTYRQFRYLMRLMTRKTVLYTPMVTDTTVVKLHETDNLQKLRRFIHRDEVEHPIVLQLGSFDPQRAYGAVRVVLEQGYMYDEINLNCGCPSHAVSSAGEFGAALMLKPSLVSRIVDAMHSAASPYNVPITVKHRLGVDDFDSYEQLCEFISCVATSNAVTHFIVHARKAFLKGLNPHENRTIPPLRYDWITRLMQDFPHLAFSINGGVQSWDQVQNHLETGVHGVMLGRKAMDNPFFFSASDAFIQHWQQQSDLCSNEQSHSFDPEPSMNALKRATVLREYFEFLERDREHDPLPLSLAVRPLIHMYEGQPDARHYRHLLTQASRERHLRPMQIYNHLVDRLGPMVSDDAAVAQAWEDEHHHAAQNAKVRPQVQI